MERPGRVAGPPGLTSHPCPPYGWALLLFARFGQGDARGAWNAGRAGRVPRIPTLRCKPDKTGPDMTRTDKATPDAPSAHATGQGSSIPARATDADLPGTGATAIGSGSRRRLRSVCPAGRGGRT